MSSWNGAGSGEDSVCSWNGAGSGVDSVLGSGLCELLERSGLRSGLCELPEHSWLWSGQSGVSGPLPSQPSLLSGGQRARAGGKIPAEGFQMIWCCPLTPMMEIPHKAPEVQNPKSLHLPLGSGSSRHTLNKSLSTDSL